MMDIYTDNQLALWANWRMRKDDGGSGYPSKSAFVSESGGGFWTPEMDSQSFFVDKAVCALISERKDVLMKFYTQSGTNQQKADRCAVSLRTYWTRLALAKHDIAIWLKENRRRL